MQNAGVPVNTLRSSDFQLFGFGEELAIYVKDEGDGRIDSSDYIEFYAKGNDGWLDTIFYGSKQNQANPYYSLVNDTIFYFLSWNVNSSNRRVTQSNAIDFGNYFAANYVWAESVQSFQSNYYDGEIYPGGATNPKYTEVEGWLDRPLALSRTFNYRFDAPSLYILGPLSNIEIVLTGQSNSPQVNDGDHHFNISMGALQIDSTFEAYKRIQLNKSFSTSILNTSNNLLSFSSVNDRNQTAGRMAMSYFKVNYPHSLNFANQSFKSFYVDDNPSQNSQFLEIISFNGGNSPVLYDVTNNIRIRIIKTINSYRALIPNSSGRKKCILTSASNIKNVSTLIRAGLNGTFTNYSLSANDSSFVIIVNKELYQSATSYAAYRRSRGFEVIIARVEELYEQYSYGIPKHTIAIQGLINEGLNNWTNPPTHLLLLGKSVNAKSSRKDSLANENNFVPTICTYYG